MSNKVPQIRFNGYSDDWEQRKLGEMAKEFKSGISLKAEYIYKFGKYPVYGGNGVRGYTNTYNHDGDFALIGRQGALSGNMNFSVGKAYFTEHAVAVKANDKNDTKFLFYLMTKLKLGKWVTQSAQPGLAVGTVVSIKVLVPNKNEQIKIANLFNDIDSTIARHQRKLDLLKEQKKGSLQKMFPKNGAKVPELRFAGFADDWEERKLQEVLRERNNQQPQSMEYPLVSFTVENGVTPKTDRYEREQLVVGDKSSKKYKVTVLNDIVYNPANLKFGAISRNKYGNAVFSPIYITFLVNNDVTTPEFIEMFVTRNDFIKRALKYQQGTVYERQSVSPTDLLAMNVYLPGKSEQEKIGSFFQQLDETIALHQRKLDLLKEQKKGFLQNMFV
ncbi:restriction endonuclease subunit S [Lactiplantibacillus plantarum]|uniref:restriction endonuclease subunit S n=1 Tax=Lactiplantibacillus plantarum TaxID=1590 RepID=UPI001ABD1702|nr:restriction endonuclease subunit S [Lactiplantibacillus plantarum]MBO3685577.1 restriction endonuclease subunit S [Lactiplantibacillus plantarum]